MNRLALAMTLRSTIPPRSDAERSIFPSRNLAMFARLALAILVLGTWQLSAAKPKTNQEHWALKMPASSSTSIDEAVKLVLEKEDLKFSAKASRKILIRRAWHVVTGLPPTSGEIEKWTNDPNSDWLARLVEELLSRPDYGERWARHWLDLARYADTKGAAFTRDEGFPYAYTYRDWVIKAFNQDLPYDQFVHRQIAADLIPNLPKSELAALGFLTVGQPWGQRNLLIADQIDVTTRGIMGLTVACARCHDHKTDPIPTADYYSLYGVFASSRPPKDLPILSTPPDSEGYRKFLADRKARAMAIHDHLKKVDDSYEIPEDLLDFSARKVQGKFNQTQRERFQVLIGKVRELEGSSAFAPPRAMVLSENKNPHQAVIHLRGDPAARGEKVPRQFLKILREEGEVFTKGSGRLELAHRLTDDRNPLTARVWANRVWMHLFGAPLVDTPGDFGPQTEEPVHRELLDYLALSLVEKNWSTKALIKEIIHSKTWQQSSETNIVLNERDPENRSLSRANRQRKDLEAWRDSMLFVSGRLDRKMGGLPILLDRPPFTPRRTIYGKVHRGFLPPLLRSFDFPNSEEATMKRVNTTTPTQALYLMNSPFLHGEARRIAEACETPGEIFEMVLQRAPSPSEKSRATHWLSNAEVGHTAGNWDYGFIPDISGNSPDFRPLPEFRDNQWRGSGPGALPDPKLGWLTWNRHGGHPEADRAVVLKWTALEASKVSISGEISVPDKKSDGLIGKILRRDGKVAGKWTIDGGGKATTKVSELQVEAGEELFFVVSCRENHFFDGFKWSPKISNEKGLIADASADFSGPGLSRLAQLAQALLLSNEFFYVD